ncbi:MAG TPA: polyprenol monophosphomannose synthase [Cytophagaceae bacterium]|jgi:dolichol-phosphate mannosyltransferase|nr:polyprenol monophosphomannose synthase [Cytophagaceae bacterium]
MDKSLVIIPTYNEIENIEAIVRKVFSLSVPFHILIVDDGSPDGTADKVKQMQLEFPERLHIEERKGKLGLGTAYIHGFRYAIKNDYAYICEMDADFSHNPDDLVRLYEACAIDGYDLAIGSRYVNGITVINWPIERVLISYFASKYVQFVTGIPIHDTTAGFKCYRKKVLEKIDLNSIKFVGYAFQIQLKFLAWKHGFKLIEVPIIFTDRKLGVSKMSGSIFKEALFGVVALRIKSIFKQYN